MLFGSVLGYLVISRVMMQAGIVDGESMIPTLPDGQRFIINRAVYRFRDPRVGEIVALCLPGEEDLSVKRVIALPHDLVQIKGGGVYVNGRRLAEPYLPSGAVTGGGRLGSEVHVVADNCFFVLGDNRAVSADSRAFGAVNRSWLVGRVEAGGR